MYYKKKGFPERSELVICTVTRLEDHAAFVSLGEYENKKGMIHISEIAYGRIRNIRNYVKVGKTIICKVLRVNEEKGHIDLSLKQVKEFEERNKWNEWKKSNRVENLMRIVGKETGKDLKWMYSKFGNNLVEEFGSLANFAEYYTEEPKIMEKIKLEDKTKKLFEEFLKDLTKSKKAEINGIFTIKSNEPEGIEAIKSVCTFIKKELGKNCSITYLGAPEYMMKLEVEDYKSGERTLKESLDKIEKKAKSLKVVVEFKKR